ncbi:MAG: class I tRNA ligase family protein [Chloroflexota bacterium]
MAFEDVPNKVDFVALEEKILRFWQETDAFNELRRLRGRSPRHWSFLDGPITANNPMGVHHAWGRTYKDLFQRFKAMQGYQQRWQNGFDCQGLWIEYNVERNLGFQNKHDIEALGLAEFVKLCKMWVLQYAAVQTEQSIRLGYWMDWNDPDELRRLREKLGEDPDQVITIQGANGPVTGPVEYLVGRLGMPEVGGSYFTFSDENNYQIWGFLKKCHQKGWIYRGHDVMPWCARCGTGMSQHEIVVEGYRETTHDSVFLRFPIISKPPRFSETSEVFKEALLVWTTTPWTLTSNTAAAVGPELTYVKAQHEDGWTYYLAQGALKTALTGHYQVLEELKGTDLVGWTYHGPFDELPAVQDAFGAVGERPLAHRVIPWKEVGEDEGTGIVHIAPGCGAEDFQLSRELKLPVVAPLDENGIYVEGFDWLTGRSVHTVANDIFDSLREKGLYYRKQRYPHRYPHCWRCGQELVYRLVDEWFISMGQLYDKPREEVTPEEKAASLRYQIMDVVDQINWIPSFGYDREMDWLRNMHDWMISKKRYWGLALPIWVCEDPTCGHFEVIGSDSELEERAVEGWETFHGHTPHRPTIDAVKIACSKCGGRSSRIADVGNAWLDAGIVPYSTLHYREDPAHWQKWFPADFVTESFPGQFRNWFYSLLAQSTALTNRPPFKNLLGYASLLGADGREMHKSWGNAIEFNEAANVIGADVMRWLFANHKLEQNVIFGYGQTDEIRRRFLIPLWNVYSFLVTYANLDKWQPVIRNWQLAIDYPLSMNNEQLSMNNVQSPLTANAQLDRWILARLNETILAVTEHLENFSAERATIALETLLDDLSNWYVRRSRRRFWKSETDTDKTAAYHTLYTVLVQMTRLLAPFIPFTAEAMYQNLVRRANPDAPLSVHHCAWPAADPEALDQRLLDKMRLAINVASLGRAARGAADFKLRQPLARAQVHVGSQQERDDLLELADVLAEEINVKVIEVVSEVGELVHYKLLPDNRRLGPKYGKLFPQVRAALAQTDPAAGARALQEDGRLVLMVEGAAIELTSAEVLVQTESRGGLAVASDKGVTVAVDTQLTPELVEEGYARDLVRAINSLRKEAGLALDDRIHLTVTAGEPIAAAVAHFAEYIKQETLAVSLATAAETAGWHQQTVEVEGHPVTLALQKT